MPWGFPCYIFNGNIWILFSTLLFEYIAMLTSLKLSGSFFLDYLSLVLEFN
jgi:hypothetical protein